MVVQGFEFEDGEEVSDETNFILANLKRKHVVYVQLDDGEESQNVRDQLKHLEDEYGYFDVFFNGNKPHEIWVIESDEFEVEI